MSSGPLPKGRLWNKACRKVEAKIEMKSTGAADVLIQGKRSELDNEEGENTRKMQEVTHLESAEGDRIASQAKRRRIREIEKDRGRKMEGKRSCADKSQQEKGNTTKDTCNKKRKEIGKVGCIPEVEKENVGIDEVSEGKSLPYPGDYEGGEWNTQALFCKNIWRHHRKRLHAYKLISKRDFLILTDTHGRDGEGDSLKLPPGVSSWWSHGSSRRGGIGIWVKDSFLAKFQKKAPKWVVILQGRAAVLRLEGDEGNIDLVACYFPTGSNVCDLREENESSEDEETPGNDYLQSNAVGANCWEAVKEQRCRMREFISRKIRNKQHTLTIVAGDFNTAVEEQDRWSTVTMCWTGNRDKEEELQWKRVVANKHGLHELTQSQMTFFGGRGRSRID